MRSGPVLLTGGCGFVGSHVAEALVGAGIRVRVADRNPDTSSLPPEVEVVTGELADPEVARRACRGVVAVCHQASRVGLETGLHDMPPYVDDNDRATAALLVALGEDGFAGRFVLASSMVVYGEGLARCSDHGVLRPPPRPPERLRAGAFEAECPECGNPLDPMTIGEDVPADPRNTYAATKLHQEHLSAVFGRVCGVAVAALRYHNVYGPRMPRDTPYAGVAAIFRSELLAGRPPQVFEDGGQRRDFVHVSDVARANLLALTAPDPVEGPLNIASGSPCSVGEVAEALSDAFGAGAPRPTVTGGFRLGDVRHVVASPDRARRVLGFKAEVDLRSGMAELARST